MTVNLLQLTSGGQESMTSVFQSPEEKEFFDWITSLEVACPGVTIFAHRLSEKGHYRCTAPAAHFELVNIEACPPRYCGCLTCIRDRDNIRNMMAWNVSPIARKIAQEQLAKMQAFMESQDGITDQL